MAVWTVLKLAFSKIKLPFEDGEVFESCELDPDGSIFDTTIYRTNSWNCFGSHVQPNAAIFHIKDLYVQPLSSQYITYYVGRPRTTYPNCTID